MGRVKMVKWSNDQIEEGEGAVGDGIDDHDGGVNRHFAGTAKGGSSQRHRANGGRDRNSPRNVARVLGVGECNTSPVVPVIVLGFGCKLGLRWRNGRVH